MKYAITGFLILNLLYFFASAETTKIGTGKKLNVEKKTTPYRDWNTGSERERTEFKLQGSDISIEKIKDLINAKHPGLLTYPTIYDSVNLAQDDLLMVLAKDSQGDFYPVIRARIENNKVRADLIEVGGLGSPINWFPDSRISGWTRVLGKDQNQYMIQSSPFKIVNIGKGELAKVDFPYAFLVERVEQEKKNFSRVVSLETGKKMAELELSQNCFSFPGFDFDHPKLVRYDKTENDSYVKYNYGPKWWDKNFEFIQNPIPKLVLKVDHVIPAPAAKSLSVVISGQNEVDRMLGDQAEIDRLSMRGNDCSKINPSGVAKAKNLANIVEAISPNQLCMEENKFISSDLKKKVCGSISRKTVFSKNKIKVNEVSFTYKPSESAKERKSHSFMSPELEVSGKKYLSFAPAESYDVNNDIKDYTILNESAVLFKARSQGPWNLYVLKILENDYTLEKITSYAYPGSNWESSSDNKFIYVKSSGILVRKNPFSHFERVMNLLILDQNKGVTFYLDEKNQVNFDIWDFSLSFPSPYGWSEQTKWSGKLPQKCFRSVSLPTKDELLEKKAQWFQQNLDWSTDRKKLIIRSQDKHLKACGFN